MCIFEYTLHQKRTHTQTRKRLTHPPTHTGQDYSAINTPLHHKIAAGAARNVCVCMCAVFYAARFDPNKIPCPGWASSCVIIASRWPGGLWVVLCIYTNCVCVMCVHVQRVSTHFCVMIFETQCIDDEFSDVFVGHQSNPAAA